MNAALQALIAARASCLPLAADATSIGELQSAIDPVLIEHGLFPNFRGYGRDGVELVLTHLETGDQYGSGPIIPCLSGNVHEQGRFYAYIDLLNLEVKDLDGNRPAKQVVPKPQPKAQGEKRLQDCTSSKELQDKIKELQIQYPVAQNLDRWKVSLPVIEALMAEKKWTAAGLEEAVARIKGSLSFVEAGKEAFSGEVIPPP
jgi:hypothetical protein